MHAEVYFFHMAQFLFKNWKTSTLFIVLSKKLDLTFFLYHTEEVLFLIVNKKSSDKDKNEENKCNKNEVDDDEIDNREAIIPVGEKLLSTVLEEFRCWLISPTAKAKTAFWGRSTCAKSCKDLKTPVHILIKPRIFDRKCIRDRWLIFFENCVRTSPTNCQSTFKIAATFLEFCHCWASRTDFLYAEKSKKIRWQKDLKQMTKLPNAEEIQ